MEPSVDAIHVVLGILSHSKKKEWKSLYKLNQAVLMMQTEIGQQLFYFELTTPSDTIWGQKIELPVSTELQSLLEAMDDENLIEAYKIESWDGTTSFKYKLTPKGGELYDGRFDEASCKVVNKYEKMPLSLMNDEVKWEAKEFIQD